MIWEHMIKFETTTGRGDDYTTGYLLDYHYFKELYKFIAIGLTIQRALGADPKAMQRLYFTGNLYQAGNTTMFFIIEEVKQTIFKFSKKKLWEHFRFILI